MPDPGLPDDLSQLHAAVVAANFAQNPPAAIQLRWGKMSKPGFWAYYRSYDRVIQISQTLHESNAPRFVLEFLLFHELLHSQRLTIAHTQEFCETERSFVPSPEAALDARRYGVVGDWRNRANAYLTEGGPFALSGRHLLVAQHFDAMRMAPQEWLAMTPSQQQQLVRPDPNYWRDRRRGAEIMAGWITDHCQRSGLR